MASVFLGYRSLAAAAAHGTYSNPTPGAGERETSTGICARIQQVFARIWHHVQIFFQRLFSAVTSHLPIRPSSSQGVDPLEQRICDSLRQRATGASFIAFDDPHNQVTGCFSNHFEPCTVRIREAGEDFTFQSSEAAFQALKFSSDLHIMREFEALNEAEAVTRARNYAGRWTEAEQSAWRGRNVQVMERVLRAKFDQHPELRQRLLATGRTQLVAHALEEGDRFWSDNGNGSGQNMLGHLLMNLREYLGGQGQMISQEYLTWIRDNPRVAAEPLSI